MSQKSWYQMCLIISVMIRRRFILCFLAIFSCMLLYVILNVKKPPYINGLQKRNDFKYILLWNKYYSIPYYGLGDHEGQDMLLDANCPVNKCYVVENRTRMPEDEYDAIIFHVYHLTRPSPVFFWDAGPFPSKRTPLQRYVFLMFESPVYTGGDLNQWRGYFNWTWTYRLDSDVPSPYARVIPINSTNIFPLLPAQTWLPPDDHVDGYDEVVNGKTHLIAWLVSHCSTQSKREEYVEKLSTYITVDYFGDCKGTKWPRNDNRGFYKMVDKNYKFYLSFENSLCKEYVTEKFFNLLKINVVPIVYGDADYKAIAPPKSYINALDYKGPKELSDYILYLDRTPEEYVKYFWWKKYYAVSRTKVPQPESLCKLCEMLHSNLSSQSYADIHAWWTQGKDGQAICREPSLTQ